VVEKSAADSVMDAGGLSGEHVQMQADEAADVLARIYGVMGELIRLPSEKDDTFKVIVNGKPHMVIKIANPHDSSEELDLQIKMMQFVETKDPSIPIPHVIESADGQVLMDIIDKAGQPRKVWAISFLPGVVLDTFDTTSDERYQVGKMLGKIRLATVGFDHPLADRMVAWDVANVHKVGALIEFVHEEHHHALIQGVLDRLIELQPRIDKLRRQVLHNDFSRSNILGDRTKPNFVSGIIDFGDASRTAIAIEVSTGVMNQFPRDLAQHPDKDLFAEGRDIVRGYLEVADLTEEEIELLPHLCLARVATRALISTRRAQLFPYNETYIMRNTLPGWAQMEWYLKRDVEEISQSFKNL
jgi:Ser/Thr protein kinase RdoA (MazF antagonist)